MARSRPSRKSPPLLSHVPIEDLTDEELHEHISWLEESIAESTRRRRASPRVLSPVASDDERDRRWSSHVAPLASGVDPSDKASSRSPVRQSRRDDQIADADETVMFREIVRLASTGGTAVSRPTSDGAPTTSTPSAAARATDRRDLRKIEPGMYETSSTRRIMPTIKLGTYNGSTALETFLAKFENCSAYYSWSVRDDQFTSRPALKVTPATFSGR